MFERCREDLAEPLLGVIEVVEATLPGRRWQETSAPAHVWCPEVLEHRCTEEHAIRRKHRGNVGDGDRLARRARQAVDHEVQCSGLERSADRKRLEDVGLDRRDVQLRQAPGDMTEDVRVGVQDRHRAAIGETGSLEEVAGAGTHIEVAAADAPPVALQESGRRAAPDEPGDGAEDQGSYAFRRSRE